MAIKKVIKRKVTPLIKKVGKPVTVGEAVRSFKTAQDIHGDVMFNGVPYTMTSNKLNLENLWKEIGNIKENLYVNTCKDTFEKSSLEKEPYTISQSQEERVVQEKPVQGLYSKVEILLGQVIFCKSGLWESISKSLNILNAIGIEEIIIKKYYAKYEELQEETFDKNSGSSLINLQKNIDIISNLIKLQNEINSIIES